MATEIYDYTTFPSMTGSGTLTITYVENLIYEFFTKGKFTTRFKRLYEIFDEEGDTVFFTYFLWVGNEPVGFALVRESTKGIWLWTMSMLESAFNCQLDALTISTPYKGKGYGRKLIDHIQKKHRQNILVEAGLRSDSFFFKCGGIRLDTEFEGECYMVLLPYSIFTDCLRKRDNPQKLIDEMCEESDNESNSSDGFTN